MKLNTNAQRSTGASTERGAGTLGMCKVTKSADFTRVARIRVMHSHWETAWEVLREQFDAGKQRSVPI